MWKSTLKATVDLAELITHAQFLAKETWLRHWLKVKHTAVVTEPSKNTSHITHLPLLTWNNSAQLGASLWKGVEDKVNTANELPSLLWRGHIRGSLLMQDGAAWTGAHLLGIKQRATVSNAINAYSLMGPKFITGSSDKPIIHSLMCVNMCPAELS